MRNLLLKTRLFILGGLQVQPAPASLLAAGALAAVLLGAPLFSRLLADAAAPQAPAQAGGAQAVTTQDDQTDLSITVYNSDLALVRDVREITLPTGVFPLKFMDIAASVNPATVHFRSLSAAGRVSVLEQNYEYDLLEPQKLLSKYVGREISMVQQVETNSTKWVDIKATLISNNNGPIWRIGNEIVTGYSSGIFRFPELPGNLYDRPTLLWTLENTGPQRQRVETSYLAGKLSWKADYVFTVNREETSADLDGWVTLVNNSGTGFENARLQLVAGDLNRVRQDMVLGGRMYSQAPTVTEEAAMVQQPFNEYHLYTLARRTSVNNNQSKQVSMLNATRVPVTKTYEVNGQSYYYRQVVRPGAPIKDPVRVIYKFKNDQVSSLGMPLPAGTVRVYQGDGNDSVLYAGEDQIAHTPKDEQVSLHTGNAFDIVAERKQTDYDVLGGNVAEMEYEITLRNHKATPITVEVNEPIGGDWQMLSSTFQWTKTAAFAAQFNVPVQPDGTSVLRYRVRVRW
jgi:hypothetical protein